VKPSLRFEKLANDYAKGRPSYPDSVLKLLRTELGLQEGSIVADIGAGTGIFSAFLIRGKYEVIAVEPSDDMRMHCEHTLSSLHTTRPFSVIAGEANNTQMEDQSVDCVTAAQAFHWFDPALSRTEFLRVLKPKGSIVFLWNTRRRERGFPQAFDLLLKSYAHDFAHIGHTGGQREIKIGAFFIEKIWKTRTYKHSWFVDFETLLSFVRSISYLKEIDICQKEKLERDLFSLFVSYAKDNQLELVFDTDIFYLDSKGLERLRCLAYRSK